MRIKTVTKDIYVADDGTEFSSQLECLSYESQLAGKMANALSDFIRFYGYSGKAISPTSVLYQTPYLAHVLRFPEEGPALEAWTKYVPSELDDCIYGNETDAWYVSDDNGTWKEWAVIQSDYRKIEAMIENIKNGG